MKRILLGIIFGAVFSMSMLSAQEIASAPAVRELGLQIVPYVQLDIMSEQHTFLTSTGIVSMQKYADNLDPFYKDFLFSKYSKNVVSSIVLNMLTGGLGSWLMGDYISGTVLSVAMLGSYGCSVLALSIPADSEIYTTGALITSGIVVVGGVLMPILVGNSWNNKLKKALTISY